MKKALIVIIVVVVAGVAFAEMMPTSFYGYTITKGVQRHTIASGTKTVSITPTAAMFFNMTGVTGTGATTKRHPLAANTRYVFDVPQDTTSRRIAFQMASSAAQQIYVTEQQ